MIPKILHFTWKTNKIPRRFQPIFDKWVELHADWEIRFWTDKTMREMMQEFYPEFMDVYDGYGLEIQRADAFRYFVLHKFGGIYADLDVEPFKRLDELAEITDLFVGLEPWDHVTDRFAAYTGLPYFLCNAFMGSQAGHPFWPHLFGHLKRCFGNEVMTSTGPYFLSGAGLTAPADIRPDLLPAALWSPLRSGSGRRPAMSYPPELLERARQRFKLLDMDGGPIVSHLWAGTWYKPWDVYLKWIWRWPSNLRWQIRRLLRPDLLRDGELFSRPALTYDDQDLNLPDPLPSIYIAVPLKNAERYIPLVKENILKFDYPPELVTVGFLISDSTDDTRGAVERLKAEWEGTFAGVEIDQQDFGYTLAHNRRSQGKFQKTRRGILGTCRTKMAKRASKVADYCLFLDSDVCEVPENAIKMMLSARRPVVMANCLMENGNIFDRNAFVLHMRPDFKYLHRAVSSDGTVYPSNRSDYRFFVDQLHYLRVTPLDSVGGTLLLIDNAVIKAGVEFSAEPYKYHLETEAFAMMARDKGFDVCGMPEVVIRHV